jgi:ribosomal protein L11 methyltransferase
MSQRYPYVHVEVGSAEDAELASAELWELGASGVEERDASTMNRPDAQGITLVASFADEAAAGDAAAALGERWPARVAFVEGDAWREAYKAYFKPVRIGARLWVKPSWETLEPAPGDVVVALDPGGAFGTGTHETTRLVLEELQDHVRPGMSVLDVGCGSGILAIAALLLGAERAVAVDNDPEAVRVSQENAQHNRVHGHMAVSDAELWSIPEHFPLVLANIERRVLVPLASELAARVQPGGLLILSGVLAPEADEVLAAYTLDRTAPALRGGASLTLVSKRALGEWVALVLHKPLELARGGR